MPYTCCCCPAEASNNPGRRIWLKGAVAVAAGFAVTPLLLSGQAVAASLSRKRRDAMTPEQVIDMLREGNARFRSGNMRSHDFLEQKRATVSGQYPAAVILSCIDSRAPTEIIFDTGIGDAFGARVAGNVATDELIGSMEFACAVAGARLVLVMGHTGCGAIAGAIGQVKLGKLTGLLEQIRPAVELTRYEGERTASNRAFVDAVAQTNVRRTVDLIRQRSPLLAGLEQKGDIKIAGAMYDLNNGGVTFMG